VPGSAAIHLPDSPEHQRRPPRPFAVGLDQLHQAVADQAVELVTDSIRMHVAQLIGDREDAHCNGGGAQHPQHFIAATREAPLINCAAIIGQDD